MSCFVESYSRHKRLLTEEVVQLKKEKDLLEKESVRKDAKILHAQEEMERSVTELRNTEHKVNILKNQVRSSSVTKTCYSRICVLTTTLGTFHNGLNRQMVLLSRLGSNHSFTYEFTHLNKYYIINLNISEFQSKMLNLLDCHTQSITIVSYYHIRKKSYRIIIPK